MIALTRVFRAAALALVLFGLALLFLPPVRGASSPSTAATVASPVGGEPRARPASRTRLSTRTIMQSNVFSSTRAPPRERYTPPELVEKKPPPAQPKRARPSEPPVRLFGTVTGPDGASALIEADPAVKGAEIYRVGERVGDRRLVKISADRVVLEGRRGRQVLRLEPPDRKTP